MKNLINNIKNKIVTESEKKNEEQRLREEKLKQIEEKQSEKNFKLFHPVQARQNRKEIKALKKEIATYNKKKKSQKIVIGCVGLLVALIAFTGVMSAIEGNDSAEEKTVDYQEFSQKSDETFTEAIDEVSAETEISTDETTTFPQIENTETTIHVHDFKEATCDYPKTCLVCGETEGEASKHNYINGSCSSCGREDPNYVREEMVWIPTNGGTKYHTRSSCSQMENPLYVTKSEAISRGFSPCGRCY